MLAFFKKMQCISYGISEDDLFDLTVQRDYWPNGQLKVTRFYDHRGRSHWCWVYKDEQGKITKESQWDHGVLVWGIE